MSVARTARFALVVAFLAAYATAALANYFDPVQTYSSISTAVTSDRYLGRGTAIADGRVIFPPAIGPNVGIYDPSTNTLTLDATLSISGEYRYYSSTLLLNGKVCFVPYRRTSVAVFDPDTHTLAYFEIPTNDISTSNKYIGGATANDGRVVMAPARENGVGVFDPTVDPPTFVKYPFGNTQVAMPAAGEILYEGAAKAGNGKIVFAPYFQATPVGIFDPSTNTFSTVSHGAQSPSSIVFTGAAAAFGGKVVLAPYGDQVAVYDPDTDDVTTTPHGMTMELPFAGAASRAYDGKVIFAPYNSDAIGVFDVRDNSLTLHDADVPTGTSMFWSPTAANATRILFVGRANAGYDLGVLDVETCDPWPNTMIPSIGRCGVPPCECCDLAMREMGLLAPCA